MIQVAGRFGFKVYYGDGTRLDVLRAAGADDARLVAICIDDEDTTNRIVDLVRGEFPGTKIFARSYDRGHTLQLLAKDVDYELRETFESAMRFGRETLEAIGHRRRTAPRSWRTSSAPATATASPCSRPKASMPASICCARARRRRRSARSSAAHAR